MDTSGLLGERSGLSTCSQQLSIVLIYDAAQHTCTVLLSANSLWLASYCEKQDIAVCQNYTDLLTTSVFSFHLISCVAADMRLS